MGSKIVYWGIYSNFAENSLLDFKPKPLLKYMADNQISIGNNYLSCPAIREKHKNTFITTIPYDIEFEYIAENQYYRNSDAISIRDSIYDNAHAFDFNISRIFFCEKPQIMDVSPAYLHRISYSGMGHAPSGSFDISKWFRPSFPTFQMWPGVDKFTAKAGEPHLYFNFPSSEKIELVQFYMTDRLLEFSKAAIGHKIIAPNQKLENLYSKFAKSGQRNIILKEIKNNIIN